MVAAMIGIGAVNGAPQVSPSGVLRVASVQMPIKDDMGANLRHMRQALDEAVGKGARVVVFPETALSGFTEAALAKLNWARLDVAMRELADLAAERKVWIIYGTATRSALDRPYNSAIAVGPDGKERARYHKSFAEARFDGGDRLALFDLDGTPCTMIVCHDNRFPELVRIPVMAGARVCFYLSYEVNSRPAAERKREGYRAQSIARAVENGIWWVQANGVGPEGGRSVSLGNSVIVNPEGSVVAHASEMKPAIVIADIRPDDARRSNAVEGLNGKLLGGWWKSALDQLRAQREPDAVKAPGTVRLALMQSMPDKWDTERNFATFLRMLDEAAGADIFITPECWLDGYAAADPASTPDRLKGVAQELPAGPQGAGPDPLIGDAAPGTTLRVAGTSLRAPGTSLRAQRSNPEHRTEPVDRAGLLRCARNDVITAHPRDLALRAAGSEYLRRVADEARRRRMTICFGFTSIEEGRLYNAVGLWGPDGELIGIYRKTHLQTHDLQFAPGDALPVWQTPFGPIGIMICADRRWPETARTLRLQGARLILNPTYGMSHYDNEWWMRTRGFENQCFVAFAHPRVGFVVGPKGELVAKRTDTPGVLLCDVELSRATDDNHIRDRRPDLYGPIVRPHAGPEGL